MTQPYLLFNVAATAGISTCLMTTCCSELKQELFEEKIMAQQ
jgi:hypothetical protein